MSGKWGWLLLLGMVAVVASYGGPAEVNPALLRERWSARWIAHEHHANPGAPDYRSPQVFGVYHFRRTFELGSKPRRFIVHVTADQRYQLYVNGTRIAWGPARADLKNWRYESVDIAAHLRAGSNVLAAVVWNFAEDAPVAQNTARTAFLLQGDTEAERIVDTGPNWKVWHNTAWEALRVQMGREVLGYWAAGPGERIHGERHPWGWEQASFDDSGWARPQVLAAGSPREMSNAPNPWMLVPRDIPLMEESPLRIPHLRLVEGPQPPGSFPLRPVPHPVAARRTTRLILDQGELTTGYPELLLSGGKGARVRVAYAEGLYRRQTTEGQRPRFLKENRDEIEGKEFIGYFDEFVLDGGANRLFRPLWWRTWRYLELTIETAEEAVTIEDVRATFTAYPFENRSTLRTSDATANEELQRLLDVGWRTARLCAHENYVDCPYYEQLQYVGDTRIQALISYYASGDARLARQAIDRIDATRTPEGLTYSRAPSELQQYIPPFSLWWIGMLHDYWMHVGDEDYVRGHLKGVRAVLHFFREKQLPTGSVGPLPWWNFVDWAWQNGTPPGISEGNSALVDLQLLLALDWAAELERALGAAPIADMYTEQAAQLRSAIPAMYWDARRGLFADTSAKDSFSQQANALAILAGLVTGPEAGHLFDAQWSDASITKSTVYFRFYTHAAARAAGRGDSYLESLDVWRDMLALGLTTWAEQPEPTRSDCHAWGSSPNYELFRTMLGVAPDAPGFARVRVAPHLGSLNDLEGSMPHPKGMLHVTLRKTAAGLEADVSLPDAVAGVFVWQGEEHPLQAGRNQLRLP
jgi:alpha-L-rhamnosidase